jgi:UDP-N-acetylmuramoylalanine--D-glutamate ligase
MRLQDLQNKKILVWGFGSEGKAVVRLLLHNSVDVAVLSDKIIPEEDKQIIGYKPDFAFLTSDNPFDDDMFKGFDIVVKSPGISLYKDDIIKAKEAGIKFTSATNIMIAEILALRGNGEKTPKIIAITGTKGKSTTSSLCTFMLEKLGYSVGFGGNIGVPATDLISGGRNVFDYVVLELSSYQTADLEFSPDVAVLLNVYPEHIEWHNDHETYFKDKTNLIRILSPQSTCILNNEDKKTNEMFSSLGLAGKVPVSFNTSSGFHCDDENKVIKFKNEVVCNYPRGDFQLQGLHNMQNICAVLTIIETLGLDYAEAAKSLGTFTSLPHRLQIIGTNDNGVTFVDDSISTTPETAIAATKTFAEKTNDITLIMGGKDRKQDFSGFAKFASNCEALKNIIVIHDTAETIKEAMKDINTINVIHAKDMENAVNQATNITQEGGVVLLSPAAPSYGFYKNFEERGKHFKELSGV